MSHPLLRECDHYLVMEPSKEERFLTKKETLQWLEKWVKKMNQLPQPRNLFQAMLNKYGSQ